MVQEGLLGGHTAADHLVTPPILDPLVLIMGKTGTPVGQDFMNQVNHTTSAGGQRPKVPFGKGNIE